MTERVCAHARAHTHTHTHCTLPQMMKQSLAMSLCLKIWDVCWLGPDHSGVDNTPPRSNYFLAWGAESFPSGQYYWEVNVTGCCNWAMGFCNDSWYWENDMVLDSEGIFLLLCIKENSQHSLFTSFPLLPQYVKKPLGQVGMFLDYDGGILSFYDVANSSLICSFLYCSFSSPLKPFLCSRYPWSEVKTLTPGIRNVNNWGC